MNESLVALEYACLQASGGKNDQNKKKDNKNKGKKEAKKVKSNPSKKKKDVPPKIAFVNTTPHGDKKDMTTEMEKAYNPPAVEAAWDAWWEQKGYYSCDVEAAAKAKPEDRFVMVIPPPNVTGTLHIGHALMLSIEDAICRWHRMNGKHVLWLPGVDHAGIATQSVVEKRLWKESRQTRHDLGREPFLEKVWKWKEEKGDTILSQFRRMGASLDHSRSVFTMDETRTKAVTEAFVRMYDKGLVFRNTRLVNWSHNLNTAISDIEVDHVELEGRSLRKVPGHDPKKKYEFGVITSFAYKVIGSDEELVVATTRLETMLGDTAVAIHPEDPRYKHLHGKKLKHPFVDREIPIICDPIIVDMEKGTGAVKITPAHDPNDYECGKRNNLPMISLLNDDGSMNELCGEFAGLMRFDARIAVEERLKELDLYRDKKDNAMSVPLCSRSGDIIEFRLKPQWFVNCKNMGARAIDKVESGELKIIPESHKIVWRRWLEDPHDWCISRQLWWGHRIPAYLVKQAGKEDPDPNDSEGWVVGRTPEEAMAKACEKFNAKEEDLTLEQDADVLDTWFSSGLFPFSVFGWPEPNLDLETFFPGALLETGHDILFFWVARMVMMSLELHDKLPFDTVYLHAMVRDKYGRKMSKALGNVIDPVAVIEGSTLEQLQETLQQGNLPEEEIKKAMKGQKMDFPDGIAECGADALRFGLISYTVQGRSINLDINRVEANRKFCNKLWQVSKFLLLNLGADFKPVPNFIQTVKRGDLAIRDRWMLSRLAQVAGEVQAFFESHQYGEATKSIQKFWLDYLCDVYVESIKPVFKSDNAQAKSMALNTLWICLDCGLRMLHPIMPFVTEELWQRLPNKPATEPESIMVAKYPVPATVGHLADPEADSTMELTTATARVIRSLATMYKIQHKKQKVYLFSGNDETLKQLEANKLDVETLGNVEVVGFHKNGETSPEGCAVSVVDRETSVHMYLKGIVDSAAEIKRLEKDLKKVLTGLKKFTSKLAAPSYQANVPEKVKQSDKEKLEALKEKEVAIQAEIKKFSDFK